MLGACLILPVTVVLLYTLVTGETSLFVLHLKSLGGAGLFLLSALGWGSHIFKRHSDADTDLIPLRIVGGLLVLYLLALVAGFAGRYLPLPWLVVHAAGALQALLRMGDFRQRITERRSTVETAAVCGIALLIGMQIALGLSPLVFTDALAYHFYAPAEFLRSGRIGYLPMNVYSNSPLALQITLGTSLALDASGQAFKILVTVLGAMMAPAAVRFASGSPARVRLLTAAFVLTYPAFWVFQSLGILDLMMASFLVFGAAWILDAAKRNDRRLFYGGVIAFGLVLASRYQSAVSVIVIALVLAPSIFSRPRRELLAGAALLAAMMLPWLVKNLVLTGNPVFPVLYGMLGGKEWSVEQGQWLRMDVLGPSWGEITTAQKLSAPVAVLLPHPWNGAYGLALFVLALLAAFGSSIGRPASVAGRLGLAGLVVWGFLHPVATPHLMRFNAHTTVFLMIAAAGVLAGSAGWQRIGTRIGTVLAVLSLLMSFSLLGERVPVWGPIVQQSARETMLRQNIPGLAAFEEANRRLDPAKDRVLLLGESRGFCLRIPSISPSPFNGPQLQRDVFGGVDPSQWLKRLHDLGITHLIVCRPEWKRYLREYHYGLNPEDPVLGAWLRSLPPVYSDGAGTDLVKLP